MSTSRSSRTRRDVPRTSFIHFGFAAQALAKIERGHHQDLLDVREMLSRGLIEPEAIRQHFADIEPELYRYPAIDPQSFRRSVQQMSGA